MTKSTTAYTDKATSLSYWTNKRLKTTVKALDDSIYKLECYSPRDLLLHEAILNELDSRGIRAVSETSLAFVEE